MSTAGTFCGTCGVFHMFDRPCPVCAPMKWELGAIKETMTKIFKPKKKGKKKKSKA